MAFHLWNIIKDFKAKAMYARNYTFSDMVPSDLSRMCNCWCRQGCGKIFSVGGVGVLRSWGVGPSNIN